MSAVRKERKVIATRFDRRKEFLNEAMKVFCSGRATRIEPTVGYHPEGNGISERSMRTISERGAAMRHEMDLPAAYWEFSNAVAAYLRNRGIVNGMAKSPWELQRGEKPRARRLRVFGCPAWVLIPKEKRTKLDRKAWQGVFVGYKDETDKVYSVWNPADKKVHEVRFVEFDESKYMDNTVQHESPSQYDDEKEDAREHEELTDDETDAGYSAKDNGTEQEAIDAEKVGGGGTDGSPTDQNTADSEEELQGDTIIVNTGEADINPPGAEDRLGPSSDTNSSQPKSRSQIRRAAVAMKRAAKQQAELERRQREEQQMEERLRSEVRMAARTLLQPKRIFTTSTLRNLPFDRQ